MKEEWKKFEDETLELLKLQGWIITSEILLEHKKVDIYAEKIGDFNKINKIGVECKYYNSPLNKSQINSIFSDYFPLCDKGIIDYVLIVTKNGVSPASLKYIKSKSKSVLLTTTPPIYVLPLCNSCTAVAPAVVRLVTIDAAITAADDTGIFLGIK